MSLPISSYPRAIFKDRWDAGEQLAQELEHYRGKNAVVVGVPRGGVVTGFVIAIELGLPLDVVLAKKLPHPMQRELAIGAVGLTDRILDPRFDATQEYVDMMTRNIRSLLRVRKAKYYQERAPEQLRGRIVILVDDGIATGNTLLACVELIRKKEVKRLVVAVPVAPTETAARFMNTQSVDEFICLHSSDHFQAIGEFYSEFIPTDDAAVTDLLNKASDHLARA